MTTSAYMADVKVEIAFNAGYTTPVASRTWTDVSQWVDLDETIPINHGRQDEFSTTEANKLSLTVDNTDGRFTPEYTSGAYYPNVKIGRPIRLTATINAVPYVRFLGYIDEWPLDWDGSASHAKAKITASSRMARLGRDVELHSLVTEELLDTSAFAYYPLNEPSGSTVASDAKGGPALFNAGVNDPVTFGGDLGLAGGGDTGATFSAATNCFLRGDFSANVSNNGKTLLVEAWVNGPLDAQGMIFALNGHPDGFCQRLRVGVAAGPAFIVTLRNRKDIIDATFTSAVVDPNVPHHVAAYYHQWGAPPGVVDLYIDGVLAGTATGAATSGTDDITNLGIFSSISVGFNDNDTIGHVAVDTDLAGIATRVSAGADGYSGETAGDRIERYAGYAEIDPSELDIDAGTSPVGAININGKTVIDAMRDVEAAEGGVLFDSPDNMLVLKSRAARYNTTALFTINAALQQVESGLNPKLDRTALFNDVTASSADGTSARVTDQASIDEYGVARTSVDIAGVTQDDVFQAASWRIYLYAQPAVRIPEVSTDLLAHSLATQALIMGCEIGDRITLSNLPAQAPAPSITFFIEGWTEVIGPESYFFTFNVSPTRGYEVWTVEDATYGAYDSNPLAY